ncbi:unnamed protein product [Gordionus sp. m RMFG-2023]|uniref:uncharacterized protein LOC135923213 isoform X2 n=1 Tax=Gordionus sp. m RMFG-2023 TaxID=3053472 RepID=UPI0030DF2369
MRKIFTKNENKADNSTHNSFIGRSFAFENLIVIVENIIAEGGFSIVFLVKNDNVNEKNSKYFALKRMLVNNIKDLEVCKREIEILKSISGHKNLISLVDFNIKELNGSNCKYNQKLDLSSNPTDEDSIYEVLIVMDYCKDNLLRQMNERIKDGGLEETFVLSIFYDICCAVTRLHKNYPFPIIHRDLKVENILWHSKSGHYILCDFGSCIYQYDHGLNKNSPKDEKVIERLKSFESLTPHSIPALEEDIKKYTTLAYRSPEMVDLYSGLPITTKADIWALGCLLYKLCFMTTPFGENTLAIHEASFSFPRTSQYSLQLHALIRYLLKPNPNDRPDITLLTKLVKHLLLKSSNDIIIDETSLTNNLNHCHDAETIMEDLTREYLLYENKTRNECQESNSSKGNNLEQRNLTSKYNDQAPTTYHLNYETSIKPRQRPKKFGHKLDNVDLDAFVKLKVTGLAEQETYNDTFDAFNSYFLTDQPNYSSSNEIADGENIFEDAFAVSSTMAWNPFEMENPLSYTHNKFKGSLTSISNVKSRESLIISDDDTSSSSYSSNHSSSLLYDHSDHSNYRLSGSEPDGPPPSYQPPLPPPHTLLQPHKSKRHNRTNENPFDNIPFKIFPSDQSLQTQQQNSHTSHALPNPLIEPQHLRRLSKSPLFHESIANNLDSYDMLSDDDQSKIPPKDDFVAKSVIKNERTMDYVNINAKYSTLGYDKYPDINDENVSRKAHANKAVKHLSSSHSFLSHIPIANKMILHHAKKKNSLVTLPKSDSNSITISNDDLDPHHDNVSTIKCKYGKLTEEEPESEQLNKDPNNAPSHPNVKSKSDSYRLLKLAPSTTSFNKPTSKYVNSISSHDNNANSKLREEKTTEGEKTMDELRYDAEYLEEEVYEGDDYGDDYKFLPCNDKWNKVKKVGTAHVSNNTLKYASINNTETPAHPDTFFHFRGDIGLLKNYSKKQHCRSNSLVSTDNSHITSQTENTFTTCNKKMEPIKTESSGRMSEPKKGKESKKLTTPLTPSSFSNILFDQSSLATNPQTSAFNEAVSNPNIQIKKLHKLSKEKITTSPAAAINYGFSDR